MSLWKSQPWIEKSCRKFPAINAQRRSIPQEKYHTFEKRWREVLECYPKMSLQRTGGLPARARKIGRIKVSLEELDRAWGRSTYREGVRGSIGLAYIASLNLRLEAKEAQDNCWITCSSGRWQRSEQVGTTPVEILNKDSSSPRWGEGITARSRRTKGWRGNMYLSGNHCYRLFPVSSTKWVLR